MPEFEDPQQGSQGKGNAGRSQEEDETPPVSTSTSRKMTLPFDEFGETTLASQAEALDVPRAGIVKQAALYFLAERFSDRLARRIPFFAREEAGEEGIDLTLEFDQEDWDALQQESDDQQTSLERLLVHATLLLLADLDSGRVAIRILEEEEEE
jgi:hypothetical protein